MWPLLNFLVKKLKIKKLMIDQVRNAYMQSKHLLQFIKIPNMRVPKV